MDVTPETLPDLEPDAVPANMLERLEQHARRLSESVQGTLPVRMTAHVEITPGGLVKVDYTGTVGDIMGKGITAQKFEMGNSPEIVAAKLYERVVDVDIARKIRTEKLREMAKELGFKLRPAKEAVS